MDLDLKDKSVIVTGGGSNIGRAIVLAFATEGSRITIGDVDVPQAQKTAELATKLGASSVQVVKTDVTNLDQVLFALLIGQPGDLEGAVGLDQAAGIVIDRFAGAREQPRRRVAITQDELRIGLAGL